MELIRIYGSEPEKRRDMVRLETGVATPRFRAQFWPWYMEVPLQMNADAMSQEQIVNLCNIAGFACGVGEWRPSSKKSKNGSYGMFHVADSTEVSEFQKLRKAADKALKKKAS
jgi:hypothetical protein